jgi:putative transcriptional regulator
MYSKLKGILVEKNITQQELAQILQISVSALNFKINGKSDFSVTEAKRVSNILEKTIEEIFIVNENNKMKTSKNV